MTLAFVLFQSSSFWGLNPQIGLKYKCSNMYLKHGVKPYHNAQTQCSLFNSPNSKPKVIWEGKNVSQYELEASLRIFQTIKLELKHFLPQIFHWGQELGLCPVYTELFVFRSLFRVFAPGSSTFYVELVSLIWISPWNLKFLDNFAV